MDIKNLIPFGKKNIEVRRDDSPFAMMQREMNKMLDSFHRNWDATMFPQLTASFMPRLDITEEEKTFTVTAELPGMNEKDIELSISGDALSIKGEKKEEKDDKSKNYYYSERSYGSFMRTIPLPRQIEVDKVSANFQKGVLTITLPKSSEAVATSKKISVKSE